MVELSSPATATPYDNLLERLDRGANHNDYDEAFDDSWRDLCSMASSAIRNLSRATQPAAPAQLSAGNDEAATLPDTLTSSALDGLFDRDDLFTARCVLARLRNFGYSLVRGGDVAQPSRNAVIEECARIAEARAKRYTTSGGAARSDEAREIAKDIRALASFANVVVNGSGDVIADVPQSTPDDDNAINHSLHRPWRIE